MPTDYFCRSSLLKPVGISRHSSYSHGIWSTCTPTDIFRQCRRCKWCKYFGGSLTHHNLPRWNISVRIDYLPRECPAFSPSLISSSTLMLTFHWCRFCSRELLVPCSQWSRWWNVSNGVFANVVFPQFCVHLYMRFSIGVGLFLSEELLPWSMSIIDALFSGSAIIHKRG